MVNKLNKTFQPKQVLKAADMNQITAKVDEVIDELDKKETSNIWGVARSRGQLDPAFQTWIGKEEYKVSNPVLDAFRLVKVRDGKVVSVLDQTDINKLKDGSKSNVVIDGSTVTDDGSDIMLCNEVGFYAVLGGTDEQEERYLFSHTPFVYKGDVAVYIPPFGLTPDYTIVKDGVQRCIRDNSFAGSKGAGAIGITIYDDNGYPTTLTSRFNYELAARKKNTSDKTDAKTNIPYASAFQFDMRVWDALMFAKFRTKDYHSQDLCGGGVSANDGTTNASTWGWKSGVRTRTATDAAWAYSNISSDFWSKLNDNNPLLKMLDLQLALSNAEEKGIAQDTPFDFDGAKWKYKNISGHKGLSDGEMTAIVSKTVSTPDGNTELCLVAPIVKGSIMFYGNIWRWVSGIEVVLDHDANKAKIYQTDDVSKLSTDTDSTEKNVGENFDFEGLYDLVDIRDLASGYSLQDYHNCLLGHKTGGFLHTGECHYNYWGNNGGAGKLARRGVLFGGAADSGSCGFRYGGLSYAPSFSSAGVGGGFRVSLDHTQA